MFIYYLIASLSVLLYLHGFFPIPARPSQTWPPNNVTVGRPMYNKTVLIVIDALRLDFISDDLTPFLSKTFQKSGCFIKLKVETPTVTLPRIKALTTGNVPQFIDIILNLASPTKVEDSFIHRAKANGKKIVFYGDDIWVKLFQDEFMRSEGTSSFFVNDFTEVDDNVTRNVRLEKTKNDWDVMILHYLGLDHIGHVFGPKSPLILTKLKEMDSIIEEIYNQKTLILITGDHGMRDSGGHGGSTYAETNVPLLVLNMPCYNDTFAQTDIPANLALLLGFDIPATSIGQLQDSLLSGLSKIQYLRALKYNTILLRSKIDLCGENIVTANHLLELFSLNNDKDLGDAAADLYKKCSEEISERLQKSSVKQSLASLIIATVTTITVLLKIIQNFCGMSSKSRLEQLVMILVLIMQFITPHFIFVIVILMICFGNVSRFREKHFKVNDLPFLTMVSILHPLTLLSSSFLEEEHQFWYFFTNTFIVLNIFLNKDYISEWFLLFAGIRFVRTINQVGDKWASEPDLADWLLKSENWIFLQGIFILGLVLSFYYSKKFLKSKASTCSNALIFTLIFVFRSVANESVIVGQILWLLMFIKLVAFYRRKGFLSFWILVISLLLKPYNVILVPVCLYASQLFHKILKNDNLVMAHWWLGNLLFFAQGHDNSLASVDISSGYIGLSQYNPLFVFPQVICHTYALPVLSHLLLFTAKEIDVYKSLSIFVFFRLYIVATVFLVTFIQRHHLFIWSVFAPKMFVEASHFWFLFIEICSFYLIDLIKKCYIYEKFKLN